MRRDLPRELAQYLEDHPMPQRVDRERPPPKPPVKPDKLSAGREGSAHPVSESHATVGQTHSVANTNEPHAERKISSARR